VNSFKSGYNSSIILYGVTGSGKTHTAFGNLAQQGSKDKGIIFYSLIDLFSDTSSRVYLSYLEIYNEKVADLLGDKDDLVVLEDGKGDATVPDLNVLKVQRFEEVIELVMKGNQKRKTAQTNCNEFSSRSHAIIMLILEREIGNGLIQRSKLSIVDLAGSERVSGTDNRGVRLNEGSNINKSLLNLGTVINALSKKGNKGFVPYRNSKLTRLLKDSLGKNSATTLIACINSTKDYYEETIHSLNYATRAKNIKASPKLNLESKRLEKENTPPANIITLDPKELDIFIKNIDRGISKTNALTKRVNEIDSESKESPRKIKHELEMVKDSLFRLLRDQTKNKEKINLLSNKFQVYEACIEDKIRSKVEKEFNRLMMKQQNEPVYHLSDVISECPRSSNFPQIDASLGRQRELKNSSLISKKRNSPPKTSKEAIRLAPIQKAPFKSSRMRHKSTMERRIVDRVVDNETSRMNQLINTDPKSKDAKQKKFEGSLDSIKHDITKPNYVYRYNPNNLVSDFFNADSTDNNFRVARTGLFSQGSPLYSKVSKTSRDYIRSIYENPNNIEGSTDSMNYKLTMLDATPSQEEILNQGEHIKPQGLFDSNDDDEKTPSKRCQKNSLLSGMINDTDTPVSNKASSNISYRLGEARKKRMETKRNLRMLEDIKHQLQSDPTCLHKHDISLARTTIRALISDKIDLQRYGLNQQFLDDLQRVLIKIE